MNQLLKNAQQLTVTPKVNLAADLAYKPAFNVNSWFSVGHFQVEDTIIDYLYHVMVVAIPNQPAMVTSCFSVTDETHDKYYGDTQIYPLAQVTMADDQLAIKVPNGEITGDLDHMHVTATMPHSTLDADLVAAGYPLLNGGSGIFPMLGMDIHQYSLPKMMTTGTLTIDDDRYTLAGETWFDRQWQMQAGDQLDPTWGWMDLNLNDGSYLSVWFPIDHGIESAWATYMTADGHQERVELAPIVTGTTDFYHQAGSPYAYPTQWHLTVPALDAEFDVTPQPVEQELLSPQMPNLNHYEAASAVTGTKQGQVVTGYCYIELTGHWQTDMFQK